MKTTTRRRPRAEKDTIPNQLQTMDGNLYDISRAYLVHTFSLNSLSRQVARKHLNRMPDPVYSRTRASRIQTLSQISSGQKCSDVDFALLSQCFQKYGQAVNLTLSRIYSSEATAYAVGKKLADSRGHGYTVLRQDSSLDWKPDNEFGKLVFERMHRNVLETAARIVLSDFMRRMLINSLLEILESDHSLMPQLVSHKRIDSHLVRTLKDKASNGETARFYYALSACRQVRKALSDTLGIPLTRTLKQTAATGEANRNDATKLLQTLQDQVSEWREKGFPFAVPQFGKRTIDFAASTENSTGQGYWFRLDPDRNNEVILYVKTPPGIVTQGDAGTSSPFRNRTISFRFLNWLPQKSFRARKKANEARASGDPERAAVLDYRAAVLDDMNQQLLNTITLHNAVRSASAAKRRTGSSLFTDQLENLRDCRRCAPPILRVEGRHVSLLIPFVPPTRELLEKTLPAVSRTASAGADRGLRYSVVISAQSFNNQYRERLISHPRLMMKRERLRQRTRILTSQIDRRKNNWEKKRPGLHPPAHILKKERELEAIWLKVRRLDREISHQVASETVWFCEQNGVKTIYFEDLKSFQSKPGMHALSWGLSANLWGQIIEGVKYRRTALGHKYGGVWTVNPAWTSQTCSVCRERGLRTRDPTSTEEEKGGEYFYCPKCQTRLHADINAARNISMVNEPSAVAGRTCLSS